MPVHTVAKPVEALKNMNSSTAKHACWVVRVLSPKITKYTFQSKGQTTQAQKFVCLLVSKDAKQFMMGSVPFNFADKDAAKKAAEKFKEGTCFRAQKPEFDVKFKTEHMMSSSIKRALLLTKPTELQEIPIVDVETRKEIVDFVDVGTSLTEVLERLKTTVLLPTQKSLLNVTGKVQTLGDKKQVTVAGRARNVSERK